MSTGPDAAGVTLDSPVTALRGVGPGIAARLSKLGIERVGDLLYHLPYRYEDRTRIWPIGSLRPGDVAQVEGTLVSSAIVRGRRAMLVWVLEDGTGRITMRLFNFYRNQLRQLSRGDRFRCFGEVRPGARGLEMVHPEYRRLGSDEVPLEDRLTPHYPAAEGISQKRLRDLIALALQLLEDTRLPTLPADCRPGDVELTEALNYVHRPPPDADTPALAAGQHPCQQRLAFDELLAHRLSMQRRREAIRSEQASAFPATATLPGQLVSALPFELTGAQQRVIEEIRDDLSRPVPMLRLLQGDVGSGKTVVAAAAAAQAIAAGYQVALAAPTELLSEQHYRNLLSWFEPLGRSVTWLTGRLAAAQRRAALEAAAGDADLIVGTHALMQDEVAYRDLGLVIVDEQHRFGVHQRMALRAKASTVPHQLIMTATPIPRTLAMTAYADLDLSVIDELPPNRLPVTTVALSNARRAEVIDRVRVACGDGQRVYWVCTIIDESDVLEAEAASAVAATLDDQLEGFNVGLIHGRLKSDEKDRTMQAFKDGELQVLVATTVIEVGVDVPEAGLMIIENAERLGLSQLHQLRGRVGRGADAASCVLLYQPPLGGLARQRLEVMRETSDGFVIARKDLELRGPGEVLGTRQTGMAQFRIADLARDRGLLDAVGRAAATIDREHPQLAQSLIDRWVGRAAAYAEV